MVSTTPPPLSQTFMDFPFSNRVDEIDSHFSILGIPFGNGYTMEELVNDSSNAPTAIRRASLRFGPVLDRWDFDLGGLLFDHQEIRIVDCGDVPGDISDIKGYFPQAEMVVRSIIERSSTPIVLGGEHGTTIPVVRALEKHAPVTLIQVDAHIDWRDEVNGVHDGLSSPIRRASELDHIGQIFQIGIRGFGSARQPEVKAALAYGAQIITAYEVHEKGIDHALARIPDEGRYYLTIDADGLDPSVMPAVSSPRAGGLFFHQVRGLIHGLVKKGRLVGMDIVEITPKRDVNGITALTAAHLITNFIGSAVRAGYFK